MVGEIFVKFDNPDNVKPLFEGDIDSIKIVANPILRPILQFNEFHRNTMVVISKELSLYIANKTIFDNLIKSNEQLYKSTQIYSIVCSLLNSCSSVINNMSLLLSNDKECVNQMYDISRADYRLNTEYLVPREAISIEKLDPQQELIEKEMLKSLPTKAELVISPDNPYAGVVKDETKA